MVSDKPKEIPRRDERHVATGGSEDTGAFKTLGERPQNGGTFHPLPPRPPSPESLYSPRRVPRALKGEEPDARNPSKPEE
jgi:hypothetical protein